MTNQEIEMAVEKSKDLIEHWKNIYATYAPNDNITNEMFEQEMATLNILLTLAKDYLAIKEPKEKECFCETFGTCSNCGYNSGLHDSKLSLMKKLDKFNAEEIEKTILHNFTFKFDLDTTAEDGIMNAMRPRFNFTKVSIDLSQAIKQLLIGG